jgi:hypothetical protein
MPKPKLISNVHMNLRNMIYDLLYVGGMQLEYRFFPEKNAFPSIPCAARVWLRFRARKRTVDCVMTYSKIGMRGRETTINRRDGLCRSASCAFHFSLTARKAPSTFIL